MTKTALAVIHQQSKYILGELAERCKFIFAFMVGYFLISLSRQRLGGHPPYSAPAPSFRPPAAGHDCQNPYFCLARKPRHLSMRYFSLFLMSLLSFLHLGAHAQLPDIQRIEQPFRWVGMQNPELQLMVYGKDLAQRAGTTQFTLFNLQLEAEIADEKLTAANCFKVTSNRLLTITFISH
jgi:hypothetical protein